MMNKIPNSANMRLEDYGNLYPVSIVNVLFAIVTFGKPTVVYYPKSVIGQLVKSLDKLITLKGLIALCVNGLLVWAEKPYLSLKSWIIILLWFGFLSITTILSSNLRFLSFPLDHYQL